MNKYNILILSNLDSIYAKEDELIAESFRNDGHTVSIKWIDYDEELDDKFDIILMRDTWVENERDILKYQKYNNLLKKRVKSKPIKKVNFYEVDSAGKLYLINYYKKGLSVIPSTNNLKDLEQINNYDTFVLKPIKSCNSAFGQKIVDKSNLEKEFKNGLLIQPKIKFKSEVQCYFVANELMYTFEFIPSKYPDYPPPLVTQLTEDEIKLVYSFVTETNVKVGFQRLDFLRLENNELILLEIEATNPFMALMMIEEKLRNKVINKYKQSIYEYMKI